MATVQQISQWMLEQFSAYSVEDYSNNGLQVEASEQVTTIAYAVDACQKSIDAAAAAGAQLLLVHHGLSWGEGFRRLVDMDARRIGACFRNGVSLWAMHLPLDAHGEFGNNAMLAKTLQIPVEGLFCPCRGLQIGTYGSPVGACTAAELGARFTAESGSKCRIYGDPGHIVRRVGIVSGGGAFATSDCAAHGIDTLFIGELLHENCHEAEERGITIVTGGHYATEICGIRALATRVGEHFKLPVVFLPTDTGY